MEIVEKDFSTIKAVFFDFDGTLYSLKGFIKNLILSYPFDMFKMQREQKVRHLLRGKDFLLESNLKDIHGQELGKLLHQKSDKAYNWYKNQYMIEMLKVLERKFSARKNVKELFEYLKSKNIKIVIYSDYPLVQERMEAIGLGKDILKLCDFICSAQEYGCLKPAPRPLFKIAEKIEVQITDCLMVGDKFATDGEGARQAGMKFVQITDEKAQDKLTWEEFLEFVKAKL
ncbi:MAG: HAD family hydrolase [Treponemataceae bacterium]|nr:HAD family hydrolase [Treponemataceae bacterium]